MINLYVLFASIIIIFAVVLIPSAIYESKQGNEYFEFNPIEYK